MEFCREITDLVKMRRISGTEDDDLSTLYFYLLIKSQYKPPFRFRTYQAEET